MSPLKLIAFALALLSPADCFQPSELVYDDSYLTKHLEDRYSYLKLANGSYIGPKDYFNFSQVFEPSDEYLANVNVEQLLFQELKAMEITSSIATMDQWHYSSEREESASAGPKANGRKCLRDLAYIKRELDLASNNSTRLFTKGIKNIQFLRYIDSWGRPLSETYYGNSYWPGSYRGCKTTQLPIDGDESMKFRFCWAKLRAKSWPEVDEMVPKTSFRVGVCLPETCDTKTANEHKQTVAKIMKFNFSPLHWDRFNQIIDILCIPASPVSWPREAKIFLSTVVAWLSLLFGVSLARALGVRLSTKLQSISLQENFERFIGDDEPKADPSNGQVRVDLRPIGVVRFWGSAIICIAHCGCSFGWIYLSSHFSILAYRSYKYLIMIGLTKVVDLFFLLGGLLASYVMISKFPGRRIHSLIRLKTYVSIQVARYLRLAPSFVLILAFMKSVYPLLAEGPYWDYGGYKHSIQGQCKRSSWLRVLGFPIMFGIRGDSYLNECLAVSWYLVADMKMFLWAPLFVYLLCRPRTPKLPLVAALTLVSSLHLYKDLSMQKVIYFKQFLQYGQLYGVNILNLTFGEPSYFSATNRMHVVAIGLYSGYLLQQYKGSPPGTEWPRWMRGWFFWGAILYELYDLITPHILHYNYINHGLIPTEETFKLFMVLKPRLDAVLFAVVVLRLVTDLAPKVMFISKPFYKLGKLSYCVFLIHTIVISYVLSSEQKTRPDSVGLEFIMLVVFVLMISFVISFAVYLLFESPMAQLLAAFSARRPASKSE